MCYNCEGEIDLDVIVCPFCAADLREEKPEQLRPSYNPSVAVKNLNTHQSLYPPHYAPKVALEEEEAPPAQPQQEAVILEEEPEESRNVWGPTVLLTLGAQLLLFGILLLLFSHKGTVILKWDATLWFIYVVASIPLLIFGYKSISKL